MICSDPRRRDARRREHFQKGLSTSLTLLVAAMLFVSPTGAGTSVASLARDFRSPRPYLLRRKLTSDTTPTNDKNTSTATSALTDTLQASMNASRTSNTTDTQISDESEANEEQPIDPHAYDYSFNLPSYAVIALFLLGAFLATACCFFWLRGRHREVAPSVGMTDPQRRLREARNRMEKAQKSLIFKAEARKKEQRDEGNDTENSDLYGSDSEEDLARTRTLRLPSIIGNTVPTRGRSNSPSESAAIPGANPSTRSDASSPPPNGKKLAPASSLTSDMVVLDADAVDI